MGLREAMGRLPETEDLKSEEILELAKKYFPDIPPEQVLEIFEALKANLGGNISNSDLVQMIGVYMKKRQEGTSRFQDLAGRLQNR